MESEFGQFITRVEAEILSQSMFTMMLQIQRLHSFYIDNSNEIINIAMYHAYSLSMSNMVFVPSQL